MSSAHQSPRGVAVTVLQRVAERGAFASAALDAELSRARLSPADAGLATEIVYGALRVLPELDRRIQARLKHGGKLDGLAQAALRAGCYQLMHLSRVPPHAAVGETVAVVRAARGAKLSGFVNAVLRALSKERPEHPEPARQVLVPEWVADELVGALGAERAEILLQQRPMPPPLCLRVAAGHDPEAVAERLRAARPEARLQVGGVAPGALLLRRAGDPRKLPGAETGEFVVQEEGAQLLALALDAQPGEQIADLCAGHGGKTRVLAEQVGPSGSVLAVDLDERKLRRIGEQAVGAPAAPIETRAIDLTVGTGGLEADFDRVLVDAPCTGLGTVHRRPELLLRLEPRDPKRLAKLQLRILTHAAELVAPGGLLAFAVCSATAAEGAGVADAFDAHVRGFTRQVGAWCPGLAPLSPDHDGILRLGPWLGDPEWGSPDAYQLVTWRREARNSG